MLPVRRHFAKLETVRKLVCKLGRRYLKAILVLCAVLLSAIAASCMTKEEYEATIYLKPVVNDWVPYDTVEVVEQVKKINGLEIARVIVRRGDGYLFSAMVIPVRYIPVGSTVKIVEVRYRNDPHIEAWFLMVL